MKSIKVLIVGLLFVLTTAMSAQVAVVGPPVWAPAAPVAVQYYYLPDIEVYYDAPAKRYMYLRNGKWFRSASLPKRYRGYDLYHSNPVYLTDYKGNKPYAHHTQHKLKYKGNNSWKANRGKAKLKVKKGGHHKGKSKNK